MLLPRSPCPTISGASGGSRTTAATRWCCCSIATWPDCPARTTPSPCATGSRSSAMRSWSSSRSPASAIFAATAAAWDCPSSCWPTNPGRRTVPTVSVAGRGGASGDPRPSVPTRGCCGVAVACAGPPRTRCSSAATLSSVAMGGSSMRTGREARPIGRRSTISSPRPAEHDLLLLLSGAARCSPAGLRRISNRPEKSRLGHVHNPCPQTASPTTDHRPILIRFAHPPLGDFARVRVDLRHRHP